MRPLSDADAAVQTLSDSDAAVQTLSITHRDREGDQRWNPARIPTGR